MGEMADMLLDQMWDEYGEEPEDGDGPPQRTKTCRMCGRTGLTWALRNDKWRLHDERGMHVCPVKPLNEPIVKDVPKTVTNEWAPRPAGYKGIDGCGQT